jgi:hypothetical protein
MKSRPFFVAALVLALTPRLAWSQTTTDPNEGSLVGQDPATGAYTFSWWGLAGRTYFLQQSDDLFSWSYLPIIESGNESAIQWGFTSSAPQSFMRLEYSDIPTDDPFNADFNGDGLTNWQNIEQGSDPLAAPLWDTNGLSLNWEQFYNIPAGIDPNAPAPRGDGYTYLQAFQLGLNPNDFYNGQAPTLAIVSGNNQTGSPGGFVPAPLVVSVLDGNGNPLTGAPVTFTVTSGGGQMQISSVGTPTALLTVLTDYNGQAKAFFQLPNVSSQSCQILAAPAGGGGYSARVAPFTESSDGGGGSYNSPFAPTNVVATLNADGSGIVTWTNNADPSDPESINIRYMDANGHWTILCTVPAGTTSYVIPKPSPP